VGREELLAAVWGLRFDPGTNVVEVHVSRLRAKLDRGFAVPMLMTDKGRGYRLTAG
jgi:two-component system OmpR family response regulator